MEGPDPAISITFPTNKNVDSSRYTESGSHGSENGSGQDTAFGHFATPKALNTNKNRQGKDIREIPNPRQAKRKDRKDLRREQKAIFEWSVFHAALIRTR